MFYAIYHPYGINSLSAGDLLIRFKTRAERDGWVDADVYGADNPRRENVSCDMARRQFPQAFRASDTHRWWQYLKGDPVVSIPGGEFWDGCRAGF